MKPKFLVILQIMIALSVMAIVLAGPAEAVTIRFASSGEYAFVDFFNDSNCQMISGFLQVSEEMLKYAPGSPVRPGPMGFLTVDIDDILEQDSRLGTATIELTSLEISGNLRSASAEGKGTLIWEQPYYYPYPPDPYEPTAIPSNPPLDTEEVTIKITWTGEGDMTSGHNNIRSTYGDIRTHMHSSGIFKYATATGLIKGETFEIEVKPPPPPEPEPTPVPDVIPYPPYYVYPAPYPYSYATIGKAKSAYMSIYRP